MPFFSVIIPTHHRPELLKQAVNSVLAQSFHDFEVLVINDRSDIKSIHENMPGSDIRISVFQNEGIGRSGARNTGISHAKGRYLCFLDDDDTWDKDLLSCFYNELEKHNFSENMICRTALLHLHEDGSIRKGAVFGKTKERNASEFVIKNMTGVVSFCFPATAISRYRFDERFSYWEDTHFLLRLLPEFNLVQMENHFYNYRYHSAMGSLAPAHLVDVCENNIAAIQDFYLHHKNKWQGYINEATLRNTIADKYLMYAVRALKSGDRILGLRWLKNALHAGIHRNQIAEYLAAVFYFIKAYLFKQ